MRKSSPLSPAGTLIAFALTLMTSGRVSSVVSLSTPARTDLSETARLILGQSLSSPSGKLTLSPEIVLPEPTDPTAILLQSSEIIKLSESIRSAKSNAAFLSGTVGAVRNFCTEQEGSRGNFPGPVPVVYCPPTSTTTTATSDSTLEDLADAGVCGVLIPVLSGLALSSPADLEASSLGESFSSALRAGLQGIPEVTLSGSAVDAGGWGEEEMESLVSALTEECGGVEPAGVVINVDRTEEEGGEEDEGDEGADEGDEEEDEEAATDPASRLPRPSRSLSRRVPILGSVRTPAGGGRMGTEVSALKSAGLTGAVLRCDCVPGYRLNPDLEAVGQFWSLAISDLKSVKSKSFGFRSKVKIERDVPMEWMNYQKDVMSSGALGESFVQGVDDLNPDAGDYKGF